jgi:hypothetical protein
VLLACCHSSVIQTLRIIAKNDPKAHLLQQNADMNRLSVEGRRILSHSFAGMALCALAEENVARYLSLASAAVSWGSRRTLELACTLRIMPFLMACKTPVLPKMASVIENLQLSVHSGEMNDVVAAAALETSQSFKAYAKMSVTVTEKILLPQLLRLGRRDLFDHELGLISPENRASVEDFAVACAQRAVPVPLSTVSTHVVDGKIVERVCAACGVWNQTGKGLSRCSRCMQVYYCGKSCQQGHWSAHKADCNKKQAKPSTGYI